MVKIVYTQSDIFYQHKENIKDFYSGLCRESFKTSNIYFRDYH